MILGEGRVGEWVYILLKFAMLSLERSHNLSKFQELTVFFNKETDLLAWKAVNRQRRENTTLGFW